MTKNHASLSHTFGCVKDILEKEIIAEFEKKNYLEVKAGTQNKAQYYLIKYEQEFVYDIHLPQIFRSFCFKTYN